MTSAHAGWRITVEVPAIGVAAAETALELCAPAIAAFEVAGGSWRIEAYASALPDAAELDMALALAAAAAGIAPPRARIEPVRNRDWVADTQASFPPFTVGPFHIHGSHDATSAPPGRIGVVMDAGVAFGSGRHASTAGALLALAELRHRRFSKLLDMGSGSGILAIAMARLWRTSVVATDVDAAAVAMTAANARRNRVAPWVRATRSNGFHSPQIRHAAPFDLIAANILAGPLMRMAGDLVACLAPHGIAVLSGILAADGQRLLAAYRSHGLGLLGRRSLDGWQTLVLSRHTR